MLASKVEEIAKTDLHRALKIVRSVKSDSEGKRALKAELLSAIARGCFHYSKSGMQQ